jgi:hypothetical protein
LPFAADLADLADLDDLTELWLALADLADLDDFTELCDLLFFVDPFLLLFLDDFLPDFVLALTLLARLPSFIFGTIFGDLNEGGTNPSTPSIKSSNIPISNSSIDMENPVGAGLTGLKVGLGVTVGVAVGLVVGVPVGLAVGLAVGTPAMVGETVGDALGTPVGAMVGGAVGGAVGTAGHTFLGGAEREVYNKAKSCQQLKLER